MTLWMGMIRAPSPDRSTDPRLTAQLVGLWSLSNNKENSADSEFMEMFHVIFQEHTSWSSVLQWLATCCERAWRRSGEVFGTGGFQPRAIPLFELLPHPQSFECPGQDVYHSLQQKTQIKQTVSLQLSTCVTLRTQPYCSFVRRPCWGSPGRRHTLGWSSWCRRWRYTGSFRCSLSLEDSKLWQWSLMNCTTSTELGFFQCNVTRWRWSSHHTVGRGSG